nr:hypothetical protein [Tanacetum cinerariifolium]
MKKKEISGKLGRVPTEMELILEHTQQGISYEVSRQLLPHVSPKIVPSYDFVTADIGIFIGYALVTDMSKVDKIKAKMIKAKMDKTRHANEKSSRNQSR